MLTTYRLIVAYDGTNYAGWQQQDGERTVAGTLAHTCKKVFGTQVRVIGASRTDAGVHAQGQVVHIHTMLTLDPAQFCWALQNQLPLDIQLKSADIVPCGIHPHTGVISKTYEYYVSLERPSPRWARFCTYYSKPINIDTVLNCLQQVIGTHDFRSFCTGYDQASTIRTISSITMEYDHQHKWYQFQFKGPGFLRYMIRRLMGAALDLTTRDILHKTDTACDEILQILHQKNQRQKLWTAPPQGLILKEITYASDLYKDVHHETIS